MTSELSDEDKWPLPDYHPEPTPKQLHALGVLSLNFVKLQGNMDELYFLTAPIHRERCFSEIFIRRDFGRGSSFGYFTA
jgi:hypothetical protein